MIYGNDKRRGITSIKVDDNKTRLYYSDRKTEDIDTDLFILWSRHLSDRHIKMHGNLHYKYATKYGTVKKWRSVIKNSSYRNYDYMTPWNPTENIMIKLGLNNFYETNLENIPILSFDIEATTLDPKSANAKVLIISNTFRDGEGRISRRMFSIDNYISDGDMIKDWCSYVREMNPAFLVGHNLFGYDLPYLSERNEGKLRLGVEGQYAQFSKRTREFRKDGSQSYSYRNINITGREIIDTFFLSIKYDTARKYPSYKLKEIIEYEGLEVKDRQHYDASTISKNYRNRDEFEKIKKYAEHDADDAISLYDLMIPAFFYYAQHIPKSFQEIINTATGSQLNSLMVRTYISKKHSIPKASKVDGYEGAISFGHPGVYKNAYKIDVASLYPSIMLQYEVFDNDKDPEGHLLLLLKHFTKERLANKKKAKETQSPYYDALQSAQKIVINSVYGFMGAPGLHFNSPTNASIVTKKGRQILTKAIDWAKGKGYNVINGDTDSITYTGSVVSIKHDLASINSQFPPMIHWEDDGIFDHVLIVKAKNYVLVQDKNITVKGSGLKATMKEPALKRFINEFICCIIQNKDYKDLYLRYAMDIKYMKDISMWCSKKTVTKSVLHPKRTNERRIYDAIGRNTVSEGDKIHVFFEKDDKISLLEDYSGIYSKSKLYEKLFKTAKIFEKVVDIKSLPNLKLKRHSPLEELL
jgi:DNA polymerase elongation subunit (family B)